mmetsp:Transcript_48199/g.108561  ORF Transcript_48199/g.108561 Transcript_48199/m.108561 type:complete len:217 (+) Transcript_48199:1302-1952(+)
MASLLPPSFCRRGRPASAAPPPPPPRVWGAILPPTDRIPRLGSLPQRQSCRRPCWMRIRIVSRLPSPQPRRRWRRSGRKPRTLSAPQCLSSVRPVRSARVNLLSIPRQSSPKRRKNSSSSRSSSTAARTTSASTALRCKMRMLTNSSPPLPSMYPSLSGFVSSRSRPRCLRVLAPGESSPSRPRISRCNLSPGWRWRWSCGRNVAEIPQSSRPHLS